MSDVQSTATWRIEELHFDYDRGGGAAGGGVIDGVSFSLSAGELVAIVGPNGCGKSTLLKLMLGALVPGRGGIFLEGKPVRDCGRIGMARRAAFVPQMAGTADAGGTGGLGGGGFTVMQTVLMARYAAHVEEAGGSLRAGGGLGIFGFESAADYQFATQAMWDADVHHLGSRDTETLSGGERQRVAIARAFAQRTQTLLLDEPTSALDLYHQLELLEQLRGATAAGRLAVLVTHDLNMAREYAQRVLVMDRGKIVADGSPEKTLVPEILEAVYQVKARIAPEGTLRFSRRGNQEGRSPESE